MCGGSSASQDRKSQLAAQKDAFDVFGTLRDMGGKLFSSGTKDIAGGLDIAKSGLTDTDKASKFYSDILSGDPTKVLAAAAPEIKTITAMSDEQKKELAKGGTRTGGTLQTAQDIESKTRGDIGDTIAKTRSGAAAGVERTGAQKSGVGLGVAGVGLGETGQGLSAESSAGSLAETIEGNAITSRQVSQQIHDKAVADWAKFIGELITAIPTGGASVAGGAATGGMGVI